jgi:hypothetical protein
MFLHFDKNKLHLQLIVGSLEKYEPTDKIREIQAKLDLLRGKLEEFQKTEIFPILTEIEKAVTEENNKLTSP